jgi:hypothetical protein
VKIISPNKNQMMKSKLLQIVTAISLSASPYLVTGQAPNLGSAAGFVLFTTNGALSNTGISRLTGHVGSNNGSSTSFGNVDGSMYNNNGATGLCASDLLTAYNSLNAAIPAFFPAPLLGNGQSLNAGVYSISGNSTLSNTLTLNAQNNPGAVFIFKIQGAFASGAGSKVVLVNGALACNVFWKIEGAVNLATGTQFKGTVIANNAAITLNSGVILEGRALTTAGAITINGTKAYTPIGCGSPTLTGPSAPALGVANCFAVFSSNGPVTNAGITFLVGDVGTNVGLTTGFQNLNVTGTVHPIPDGTTAACASDLLNAYNYLNTLTYDIELLYPAQFGNSLVLTPHTYIMNGATTFIDTLFLNGGGNPNAVFVIQINGALSTGTYAKVSLTNGTQAQNVFWKVDGAVNLDDYTEFAGTIIANNGAINLNTGAVINGRALTTNGAVGTDAVNVTMPPGCGLANTAPAITTQPVNQTVCAGDKATFAVTATGTALIYKWRKGTVDMVNGGSISGVTTATLVINPASGADIAANYNVIVSGSAAPDATSTAASLAISAAPAILTAPVSQVACIDAMASFQVAAGGSGISYQWKKGLVNLINGANISGATSATLVINSVTVLDLGTDYRVILNACSSTVASADVSLIQCSVTGINDADESKTATLYPNPFSGSLSIMLNEIPQQNHNEVRIFNMLGAEVLVMSLRNSITTIEAGVLAPGVYQYNISFDGKILQVGKLVSQ